MGNETKIVRFVPSPGFRLSQEQAEEYGFYIHELTNRKGTALTPEELLDAARDAASPLYSYIEWDDEVAAHKWRMSQCQYVLRGVSLEIVRKDKPDEMIITRAIHNVVVEGKQGYVSLSRVVTEESLRQQVLDRAKRELKGWTERYAVYEELDEIREPILAFLKGR